MVIPPPTTKQDRLARLVRSGQYETVYAEGGSQSGKTWLLTREGHRRNCLYPGCRGLVVRKHYADIRTKWWRQTYKPLVAEGIREGIIRLTESPLYSEYWNGSSVQPGMAANANMEGNLGPNYNWILLEECSEIPWAAVEKLRTRLNQHFDGAPPIMMMTWNPPPKTHWTYQVTRLRINPADKKPLRGAEKWAGMHFVPHDNPHNAPGYIDTLEGLSERQRLRFLLGEYAASEGAVFPEFDPTVHVGECPPPPKTAPAWRGIDFGYNHPTACIWAYRNGDMVYIYREYRQSEVTADLAAERIIRASLADITIRPIGGTDGNATAARYRTVSDHQIEYRMEFRRCGVETVKANKAAGSVSISVDHLKRLFRDRKILIDKSCHGLIEELAALEWERDPSNYDSMEESIKKVNDDLTDALRYVILDMFAPKVADEPVLL